MEKAKLKAIIHDLENVLESLKSEVYADATSYLDHSNYEEIKRGIQTMTKYSKMMTVKS